MNEQALDSQSRRKPLWSPKKDAVKKKTLLECYEDLKDMDLTEKWLLSAEETTPKHIEKAISSYAEGLAPETVRLIVDPSGSRTGKKGCIFTDEAMFSSELKDIEGHELRYDSILDVQWSGVDFISVILTTGRICTLDLGRPNAVIVKLLRSILN